MAVCTAALYSNIIKNCNAHLPYMQLFCKHNIYVKQKPEHKSTFLLPDFKCFCPPATNPGNNSLCPIKQFSGKRCATFNSCWWVWTEHIMQLFGTFVSLLLSNIKHASIKYGQQKLAITLSQNETKYINKSRLQTLITIQHDDRIWYEFSCFRFL